MPRRESDRVLGVDHRFGRVRARLKQREWKHPEHAKLRVTITASPDIAAGLMRLVNTLLED